MNSMEKQFIPYELALRLKELEFNEECFRFYFVNKKLNKYCNKTYKNSLCDYSDVFRFKCTSPLWQQAFDWFRKRYSKNSWIEDHYSSSTPGYFEYTYHISIMQGGIIKSGRYKTYEEARQACLEKLIELCKKK